MFGDAVETVSGIVKFVACVFVSVTVTVTSAPSRTGFGDADTVAEPASVMVTVTEFVVPAVTDPGRVPSATVNVSSFSSVSLFVEIVPVPLVCPAVTVIPDSVPTSPDSAVFGDAVETVSGIVTFAVCAFESVAVTVTSAPSPTGFGDADSDTEGLSSSVIVTRTEAVLPRPTAGGRVPSATVNVSSSASASWFAEIVPVPVVDPDETVIPDSVPKSPVSAVPAVSVSGIVTFADSDAESVAVTVTSAPSPTGFGNADSDTVGPATPLSMMVTTTEGVSPAMCPAGRLAVFSATVNVSSAVSASTAVVIIPVPVESPPAIRIDDSVP